MLVVVGVINIREKIRT